MSTHLLAREIEIRNLDAKLFCGRCKFFSNLFAGPFEFLQTWGILRSKTCKLFDILRVLGMETLACSNRETTAAFYLFYFNARKARMLSIPKTAMLALPAMEVQLIDFEAIQRDFI